MEVDDSVKGGTQPGEGDDPVSQGEVSSQQCGSRHQRKDFWKRKLG